MGIVNTAYRFVFKRTSTFALAFVGGAFLFERAFDKTTNSLFENMNQGKLWKHIRSNYESEE